jgi:hypothetical protein
MRIAITAQDGNGDFQIPSAGPWTIFFKIFTEKGHKIVGFQDSPNLIIFMNSHPRLLRKANREFRSAKKILILWESSITRPQNFIKGDLSTYDFIFTPSNEWIQGLNVRRFNWPQGPSSVETLTLDSWNQRSDTPVIIQANKYSFVKGEKYSLRRKLIFEMGKDLIVYGNNWNRYFANCKTLIQALFLYLRYWYVAPFSWPKYVFVRPRKYGGFNRDKKIVLESSKFSVVIENSSDYISEKIIESISFGSLVIYCGPPLSEFGLPSKIVYSCKHSSSDLITAYHFLLKNKEQAFEIVSEATKFHKSELFNTFHGDYVLEKLAIDILKEIGSN